MIAPLTFERLHERGAALFALQDAGANIDRLVRLDRLVRGGACTDFPGRLCGADSRDVPPPPMRLVCARCGGDDPGACGCWSDLGGR